MKLNILQKFTVLSIVVTVAIVVVLGVLVSTLLNRWLLAHEVRITAEALRAVTMIDLPPQTFVRARGEKDARVFKYIWSHLQHIPDVLRVKIYDTQGRIVWSDEEQLIGKVFTDNEELNEALKGEIVAEMGKQKTEHELETPLAPESQLLEIYVPLVSEMTGTVYGVFELYKHPASFFRSKRRLLAIVWGAGVGGGLVLFLSLFGLFRSSLREQTRLQRVERQYDEIEFELEVAAEIQRGLLPGRLPEVPGLAVAAVHQPAREIGGDFYDAFVDDDGALLIVVADGEGKSIPGALLMVETRSVLATEAHAARGVREIAQAVNRTLATEERAAKMVTMFLAKLDPVGKKLSYCSAGHCPGLLVRNGEAMQLDVGGVPLGVTEDADYEEGAAELAAGDVVLMYTDGVTEAANAEGQLFGRRRLQELLCSWATGKSPDDILQEVSAALVAFTGGRPPSDDTTMVCVVVG
jgi:serine phosphatase RsbU (regulator of sigma subunit)